LRSLGLRRRYWKRCYYIYSWSCIW